MTISDVEILQTKLLAKAVIEKDGKIEIIAVFAGSDFYRFFFIFHARSRRSPRKSWVWKKIYQSINAGMAETFTLETFLARRYAGRPVKIKHYISKKYLSTFTSRIAHSYSSPETIAVPGATYRYAAWVSSGKRGRNPLAYRGKIENRSQ
jgi:hypothetical protein